VATLLLRIQLVVLVLCTLPEGAHAHRLVALVEGALDQLGRLDHHFLAKALSRLFFGALLVVQHRSLPTHCVLVLFRDANLPIHFLAPSSFDGLLAGFVALSKRILVFVELCVVAVIFILFSATVFFGSLSQPLASSADTDFLV
jgi:hypothetical protein